MNLPSSHRAKLSCEGCCYKMQPSGLQQQPGQARPLPPRMPAWPSEQALWRSSQECCCLALEGGGRPPGTQMYKLQLVILVPSTAVWEPWALWLPRRKGFTSTLAPPRPSHRKGIQAHKRSQSRYPIHSKAMCHCLSKYLPFLKAQPNLLPEDSLVLVHCGDACLRSECLLICLQAATLNSPV